VDNIAEMQAQRQLFSRPKVGFGSAVLVGYQGKLPFNAIFG
jgi:hypothetical protein